MKKGLKYVLIALYVVVSFLIFAGLGIAIKKKYVTLKRWSISILFGAQYLLFTLLFKVPLYANILLNVISCIGFFLGIKMQVIGLTGGIACGKSTVCDLLRSEGFTIIDCDQISRDLRSKDTNYQRLLVKTFGTEVWDEERKQINSEKLGQIVFSDPAKRKKLNSITHWRIFKIIFQNIFYQKIVLRKSNVILDAPLLFETKILEHFCYPILLVFLEDRDIQKERLMSRNQLSEEESEQRINSQFPMNLKIEKSQILIDNSYSLEDLER